MVTRDIPWPDGTPCWLDLMTHDAAAARSFYGALFGWDIEVGGEETGFYGMCTVGGRQVGGIGQLQMEHPPVWTTYLATSDVDATVKEIGAAGGTVVQEPMDVFDFGRMAVAQDPTGGTFGLWQAGTHIGMAVANEPNTPTWNEFMTRDYPRAREFFTTVFGWTYTVLSEGDFEYSTFEVDGNTAGGIGALPAEVPQEVPAHWRAYFAVDDADTAVARASALGGSVLRPPEDMPYGRHADLADPQGATFCVIKPATPE